MAKRLNEFYYNKINRIGSPKSSLVLWLTCILHQTLICKIFREIICNYAYVLMLLSNNNRLNSHTQLHCLNLKISSNEFHLIAKTTQCENLISQNNRGGLFCKNFVKVIF